MDRGGHTFMMKLLVNRNVHNAEKELTASTQVVASVVLTFTRRFRREFCDCDAYPVMKCDARKPEAAQRARARSATCAHSS